MAEVNAVGSRETLAPRKQGAGFSVTQLRQLWGKLRESRAASQFLIPHR
jgi:hypothetical protein